jgi:hypothetical protein
LKIGDFFDTPGVPACTSLRASVDFTAASKDAQQLTSDDATEAAWDCNGGACCGQILSPNHSTPIVICETRGAENRTPCLTPTTAS